MKSSARKSLQKQKKSGNVKVPKWKIIVRAIVLALPLVLAIVWLIRIKTIDSGAAGFLSPVNTAPIVMSLSIFMAGYVLFLFLMFYSNIKEALKKHSQKN